MTQDTDELLSELDAAMHRMGRLMASRQSEFAKHAGLPAPQYMVLRTIEDEGPMRVSAIAATLGVKMPAASGLIQSLEHEGYVARENDPLDHRGVVVSLTTEGRRQLARAVEHRRGILHRFTADLTADDLRALIRISNTLADTVARSGF